MAVLAALCLLWAGMVLGISFLEAPVKFTTPSLTLSVGLDVGRHVFGAFHKVEWFWVLACFIVLWRAKIPQHIARVFGVALGILLLQSLWLWPVLDDRVTLILRGEVPPSAPYHLFYVAAEVVKLLALIVCGTLCLRGLQSAPIEQAKQADFREKLCPNP